MDTKKTILLICLVFSLLISVKAQTHAIIGLFPINLAPANEVTSLRTALNEYRGKYLPPNTQLDIKLYNNSNQPDLTMKIMLDTFTRPNNFTAIIGPGDEKAIHTVDQFLSTIPGNVLHLVNNPVIDTKKYLHNMAPSVSQIVDLLIELLQNMKWNYVAVLRDSTEFSKLSSKIFQKKAESEHICIGLIEAITLNIKPILDPIKAANIKGVIVFGTKDTVRLISRNVKDGDFRFIFVSNKNLHEENINIELPDLSLQVTWNGPYNESSHNNKLNYIDDSVEMALKWFNICQTESKCRDLPQKEIILEIYQKLNNKQERVGTFTTDLTLNSKLNKVESFCKSGCEKCHKLDCVGNLYNLTSGEYYVVVLLPIHGRDSSYFRCNCSINVLHSVDLMEAAKFAISTSAKPDLGLIIIDTCMQPIITTEQLIDIDYTNVLGVIGAFYSLTTIPAAEILTRLKIPQISFGAESHILSDQERFPYFQRTTISIRPKAKAIILLCKRMGWKAINIMYNKEPFGVSGRSLIMEYAQIHGICIVNDIGVELEEVQFQTYLNQLRKTSKVKVTVTFFLEESQKKWLKVLNEDLEANEFLIIEAYGVRDANIQKILKTHFTCQVIIEANKPSNQGFLEYYKNLQQEEIEKNPLAKKFIEKNNRCHFDGSFNIKYEKKCEYRLPANYSVSTYYDLLIKAIYALINGTRNATNNLADFKQRNPADIVRKIRKTRFNISGKEQRLFDDEGKRQIQLFNLLKVKTIDPLEYEKIAVYESESWQIKDLRKLSQVTSTCSSDDSCTKCPEVKSDHYFLIFVILDSILAFIIAVLIGVFIWKKKSYILAYFGGVCP